MTKILQSLGSLLVTGFLITLIGCTTGYFPDSTIGLDDNSVEHTVSNVNNINQTSLNSMSSQQDSRIQNNDNNTSGTNGPEIVDNLKSIEIENLNDKKNSKVTLNLPEGWYAKELISDKAPDFEFNAVKNKQIKKAYSFEIYNLKKMDKYKQFVLCDFSGWFEMPSYYRDQSERARFPNHCQVKSRVYAGDTILGQGEIFILGCDIPDVLRTDQYSTYDMIYAWVPIKDEALAYNLSISVPLDEKDDGYIEMVKKMLKADK